MTLISWNVKGLGNSEKESAARKLTTQHQAKILLLQETKLHDILVSTFQKLWRSGNFNWLSADSVGASKGLILVWEPQFFTLEQSIINKRFILAIGNLQGVSSRLGIGNMYAPNDE